MFKKFKDFLLRLFFQDNDYIVGYSGETGEEIRVKWNDIKQSLTGEPGKSVQIQFSANNSEWHYPGMEGDKFVKFKLGNDDFSPAYKIVGEGEGSSGGDDGREVRLDIVEGSIAWQYVGETEWKPLVALSSLKGQTGQQGTPGTAATVQVGSVTTGSPGTYASVQNVGTATAAILNFTIPQGVEGQPGTSGQSDEIDKITIEHSDFIPIRSDVKNRVMATIVRELPDAVTFYVEFSGENPKDVIFTIYNMSGNHENVRFYTANDARPIDNNIEVELQPRSITLIKVIFHGILYLDDRIYYKVTREQLNEDEIYD